MKFIVLSIAGILLSLGTLAQDNLSLRQCVQMAVERNINVEKTRIDVEKSGYKVEETRAALLPKVNVNGSFTDFTEKSKNDFSRFFPFF
jgi:outer membrane protein TolC